MTTEYATPEVATSIQEPRLKVSGPRTHVLGPRTMVLSSRFRQDFDESVYPRQSVRCLKPNIKPFRKAAMNAAIIQNTEKPTRI